MLVILVLFALISSRGRPTRQLAKWLRYETVRHRFQDQVMNVLCQVKTAQRPARSSVAVQGPPTFRSLLPNVPPSVTVSRPHANPLPPPHTKQTFQATSNTDLFLHQHVSKTLVDVVSPHGTFIHPTILYMSQSAEGTATSSPIKHFHSTSTSHLTAASNPTTIRIFVAPALQDLSTYMASLSQPLPSSISKIISSLTI